MVVFDVAEETFVVAFAAREASTAILGIGELGYPFFSYSTDMDPFIRRTTWLVQHLKLWENRTHCARPTLSRPSDEPLSYS